MEFKVKSARKLALAGRVEMVNWWRLVRGLREVMQPVLSNKEEGMDILRLVRLVNMESPVSTASSLTSVHRSSKSRLHIGPVLIINGPWDLSILRAGILLIFSQVGWSGVQVSSIRSMWTRFGSTSYH